MAQSIFELITETLQHSGHNVPWAVRAEMVLAALYEAGYDIVQRAGNPKPKE